MHWQHYVLSSGVWFSYVVIHIVNRDFLRIRRVWLSLNFQICRSTEPHMSFRYFPDSIQFAPYHTAFIFLMWWTWMDRLATKALHSDPALQVRSCVLVHDISHR